jgi:hypothetical protein
MNNNRDPRSDLLGGNGLVRVAEALRERLRKQIMLVQAHFVDLEKGAARAG